MIDVLLPFYGPPEYLFEAVDSVRGQTVDDWRLVVVDDCHPDLSVARWFAELDDPRIEYHRNPTNLGANANYVRALSLARADWFVMMGADDVMAPCYLEVVEAAAALHPDAAVVTCRVDVIDADGRAHSPLVDRVKRLTTPRGPGEQVIRGEDALVSLLRGNWTYFPSLCWRRDRAAACGFRPTFSVVQDLALLVDVLVGGGSLVVAPHVAFDYRRHARSDSARKTVSTDRFTEEARYFATISDELAGRGMARASRAARRYVTSRAHAALVAARALGARDGAGALRLLRHACAR
jgi:hypothetical protein